jgi:UDP-hydrolysing UDP-N-acetyl-D-glucosamine 2-epimerase
LSDVHFVASAESKERVIRMGEDPETVFNFGDPAMDILKNEDLAITNKIMQPYGGVGSGVDWTKPYFLIVQHPVTTSYREGFAQVSKTLEAVKSFSDYQKIVLWPNIDAGSDDVSKGIRIFREKNPTDKFHYYRNFTPEDYARVLNNAKVAIGNSSSFLREGAFLGTPTVLVGDRQQGREHGKNIEIVGYDVEAIKSAIGRKIEHGRYPHDPIFGSGSAGRKIANVLSTIEFNKIKRIQY